jgi:hypothetical protein
MQVSINLEVEWVNKEILNIFNTIQAWRIEKMPWTIPPCSTSKCRESVWRENNPSQVPSEEDIDDSPLLITN